ncbi:MULTISPECIES: hypothetical protein [Acidiphilium]|uniref:Uncharacterized protein n=1 Tax=Acidiphilium rubrum TaxID=526 RepID=A0A8G2CMC6_ACIRU|nr:MULTISPECIES: hypothetical protein [Acidiphilium]SIQ95030.1 hypothetical protein SAMN05421828_11265 [Acidiphilium rubrum]
MTSVAVTLGGVAFRDFEVPAEIKFGGTQRLAVHQPVGGGRVVDVLGAAAGEITFGGTFSGPDAALRAQALDVALNIGATLPLAWDGFAFSVVITAFTATYQKPWWIPFQITLLSVENLVTAIPSALAQAGLDIASAAGFGGLSGVSLAGVSAGSSAGIAAGQASLAEAVSGAGSVLSAATTLFSGGVGAAQPIGALAALGAASSTLAGAAAAQAYLGRAAANVGLGAL